MGIQFAIGTPPWRQGEGVFCDQSSIWVRSPPWGQGYARGPHPANGGCQRLPTMSTRRRSPLCDHSAISVGSLHGDTARGASVTQMGFEGQCWSLRWDPTLGIQASGSSETGMGFRGQQWSSRWALPHGDKARGSSVNGMGHEMEVSPWGQSKHPLCPA